MVLVSHMILQDHVIKGSCDFKDGMLSQTPAKFGGPKYRGSRNIMVLVCHIILQDHVTKVCSNIMGRSPSSLVTILPIVLPIVTVLVEIWYQRYQVLHQFLHEYLRKSWTHCLGPLYLKIFEIRNTDLQFQSTKHGLQKNYKKASCKVLYVSHKCNNQ